MWFLVWGIGLIVNTPSVWSLCLCNFNGGDMFSDTHLYHSGFWVELVDDTHGVGLCTYRVVFIDTRASKAE